jgi:hypothetical protein
VLLPESPAVLDERMEVHAEQHWMKGNSNSKSIFGHITPRDKLINKD